MKGGKNSEAVLTNPMYAVQYAAKILKEHDSKVYQIALTSPYSALIYAETILKTHDEACLNVILASKNKQLMLAYCKNVLHGPDPRIIPYMCEEPKMAFEFAKDVCKQHNSQIFQTILTDPMYAVQYTALILKAPNQEVYNVALKNPSAAVEYANKVLKNHDEACFQTILESKDYRSMYNYCLLVLKGSDSRAIPIICQNPRYAFDFSKNVLKKHDPTILTTLIEFFQSRPFHPKNTDWLGQYFALFSVEVKPLYETWSDLVQMKYQEAIHNKNPSNDKKNTDSYFI